MSGNLPKDRLSTLIWVMIEFYYVLLIVKIKGLRMISDLGMLMGSISFSFLGFPFLILIMSKSVEFISALGLLDSLGNFGNLLIFLSC